jgi:hypothetical protein
MPQLQGVWDHNNKFVGTVQSSTELLRTYDGVTYELAATAESPES